MEEQSWKLELFWESSLTTGVSFYFASRAFGAEALAFHVCISFILKTVPFPVHQGLGVQIVLQGNNSEKRFNELNLRCCLQMELENIPVTFVHCPEHHSSLGTGTGFPGWSILLTESRGRRGIRRGGRQRFEISIGIIRSLFLFCGTHQVGSTVPWDLSDTEHEQAVPSCSQFQQNRLQKFQELKTFWGLIKF